MAEARTQCPQSEKGLWILAPMVYKADANEGATNYEATRTIRGFKPVLVFEIAQTDGEPLPDSCCTRP
jgi:hypothetical protein